MVERYRGLAQVSHDDAPEVFDERLAMAYRARDAHDPARYIPVLWGMFCQGCGSRVPRSKGTCVDCGVPVSRRKDECSGCGGRVKHRDVCVPFEASDAIITEADRRQSAARTVRTAYGSGEDRRARA